MSLNYQVGFRLSCCISVKSMCFPLVACADFSGADVLSFLSTYLSSHWKSASAYLHPLLFKQRLCAKVYVENVLHKLLCVS